MPFPCAVSAFSSPAAFTTRTPPTEPPSCQASIPSHCRPSTLIISWVFGSLSFPEITSALLSCATLLRPDHHCTSSVLNGTLHSEICLCFTTRSVTRGASASSAGRSTTVILGFAVYRLRVLSCSSWLLSRHVQKFKLQAPVHGEVDSVVGRVQRVINAFLTSGRLSTRLPGELRPFSVSSQLHLYPQVERTPTPFWITPPYYSTEDFIYEMHISKNTAVILNCYGIHHDKERFQDPYAPTQLRLIPFNLNADKCAPSHGRFAFNPERFLSDTLIYAESSNLNAMDRDNWAFGAEYIQSVSFFLPAITG